jgi:4-hydroxy-3-methylbut-2-enyl diphosphate reductase
MATCPLVSKVHLEATRHYEQQLQILLIGHAGHPEVAGTMGQLPNDAVNLLETVEDARDFVPKDPEKLAYVTQTTLSVDDTAEIVAVLKSRFPKIVGPQKQDICYATTNRQAAVKAIAPRIGCLLVVGSPQSSNSLRLVEVAQRAGCSKAKLIERATDIPWSDFEGLRSAGITAGASAPEALVSEVIDAFRERFDVTVETVKMADEKVAFNVPRELRATTNA